MKYLIYAPPYRHNCAGIRVLYRLNEMLIEAGQESEVIEHKTGHIEKNAIGVYSDIYQGNPMQCKKAVRYLLYHQRYEYEKSDPVFVYNEMYGNQPKLEIMTIELDIFRNRGFKRDIETAVYYGKGNWKLHTNKFNKEPSGYKIITQDWPPTRKAVAKLLNRSKKLICFDPASAIMWEAALCGCPTILLNEYEQHEKTVTGHAGICDSPENIQKAIDTMPRVREKLIQIEVESREQLKTFIKKTQ